jgi:hypothetical protein
MEGELLYYILRTLLLFEGDSIPVYAQIVGKEYYTPFYIQYICLKEIIPFQFMHLK